VKRLLTSGFGLLSLLICVARADADVPVELTLTGDWNVQATLPADGDRPELTADIIVAAPPLLVVSGEKYDRIPVFNPKAGAYARGEKLRGVRNAELTTRFLLDPDSLIVRSGLQETDTTYVLGKDYDAELSWGNFGRLSDGRIAADQPVYVSYRHGLLRLDSIVLTTDGKLAYRTGHPVPGSPVPPALEEGERRLANLWISGHIAKLTDENLFPILETAYPASSPVSPTPAEQYLPKTLAKLRSGEPVRILAWGDSVTESTYLPDREQNCWQSQFVERLRKRFPNARIELITEGWGGRSTQSFLTVPPGEPHNYAEKVLAPKPDLIISEFVNDAYLNPEGVEKLYSRVLGDFQEIGAEWIILTPHYVRPDWMQLTTERKVDDDPRPYVAGLRQFAKTHNIALADAAKRYGRLWRQGIPYSTLMSNAINHPDARGMTIFADALMEIFPEE